MNPISELETPIRDAQMTAQVLAAMFEDAQMSEHEPGQGIRLTDHEVEMLSFLIYDLCKRTKELSEEYYAAYNASKAPAVAKAA